LIKIKRWRVDKVDKMDIDKMDKIEELLTRRVEKIYPSKKALEKVLRSGKKLKLYLGIDPTATRLHLGHTIPLRSLQAFADLGHEAILLFGTGTVLVGDPSERKKGRKLITDKEITENIKTWKEQVKPLIDFAKVKVRYNGDWINKMNIKDFIRLGSKLSATQLFKRDNFQKRIEAGDNVCYHETIYPLLQGYDSVVMNVDLEIGGTDQTFNMLIGRELQHKINKKEKFVLTTKMIMGTDGKKMSKTSENCIWLTDTPQNMYGKIMSIGDSLIGDYFEFFTSLALDKIEAIKKQMKTKNPMVYKKQLALAITRQFHGREKANIAQKDFEIKFQKREVPKKIKNVKLKIKNWNVVDLLVETKLAPSKSEAKRLIQQGAVKVNGSTINHQSLIINHHDIINIGKRKWVRINGIRY
jgi:tyrosyl-tRNA synthetase